jgi:hypothetical protein
MKIKVHNKGNKQIFTPYPSKVKINAGKKGTFEVADAGVEALMIMGWALAMKDRKVDVIIEKGGKKYEVVRGGSMPRLKEV